MHVIVQGAAPNRQEGLNVLAQKYLSGATRMHVIARSRRGEPGRLSDVEVDDLCRGARSSEEYVYLVGRGGIIGNGEGPLEAERALARLIASHTQDAAQVGRLMDRALLGQRPANADGPDAANPRARQNVILEHGFVTREPVVALHMGEGELPSDCDGVLYTPYVRSLQPQ